MRGFAARHPDRTTALSAPGWVDTDLGSPEAGISADNSIPNLVDLLMSLPGKAGLQYLDYLGQTVPW